MTQKERRTSKQKSDTELYKARDIERFIEKERRQDELNRLHEVRQQKKIWWLTMMFCGLLNLALVSLALLGVYYG